MLNRVFSSSFLSSYSDLGLDLNVLVSDFPKSSLNALTTLLNIVREMHCSGELTSSAGGQDVQWLRDQDANRNQGPRRSQKLLRITLTCLG